jgi:hypothetical protein
VRGGQTLPVGGTAGVARRARRVRVKFSSWQRRQRGTWAPLAEPCSLVLQRYARPEIWRAHLRPRLPGNGTPVGLPSAPLLSRALDNDGELRARNHELCLRSLCPVMQTSCSDME